MGRRSTTTPKSKKTKKKRMAKGVYRLPDGRWWIRVDRSSGEATRYLEADLSLGQVVDLRAELAASLEQEAVEAQRPPSLATYAASWLTRRSRCLKPATLRIYASHLELHVRPALGALRLDEITRLDLIKFRDHLDVARVHRPGDKGKGLSPHPRHGKTYSQQTVDRIWGALLTVLRDGLADYDLPDIAARLKGPTRAEKQARKGRALSQEELDQLLGYLKGHSSFYLFYLLLACTGMRQGEARTLTWDAVDVEHRAIRLRDAKTGPRVVPLPEALVELLQHHRQQQLRVQAPGFASGRVFNSKKGATLSDASVTNNLRRASERAGLEPVTPHDLRRTFVTLAVEAGISSLALRAVVGHSNQKMQELYYRAPDESRRKVVEVVSRQFKK